MKTTYKIVFSLAIIALAACFWLKPSQEVAPRIADPVSQRQTQSGPVIGSSDTDDTYAWLGIPFAAPPVGDLRWRAPRPVAPWQQPRQAIAFGNPCIQSPGPLDGLPDTGAAIVGESAGGRNVYPLLASPPAKGLFHRAIAQSGSVATTPRFRAENFHDAPQPGQFWSSSEWLALQLHNAGLAADRAAAKVLLCSMSTEEIRHFMYSHSPQQILEGMSGGAGMYRARQALRDGTVLLLGLG